MAHLHAPASASKWFKNGTNVATYVDKVERSWSVIQMPGIINFVPQEDVLEGTLDLREMLAFLTKRKLITGQEFYNGHGIGIEPKQFGGRVTLSTPSVTYA